MSDKMNPIPFPKLINWLLEEYCTEQGIFFVKKTFIYDSKKRYSIFGEKPEAVFGPAAGPHTQLAQNIIAGYFAGARFFELKTVQIIDGEDLKVMKPCIKATGEGYNVEWSTELTVEQAMEEYIKAWFALKIISREFGLGNPDGFVFNMSVGYDFEGICSVKINNFIEGLKDAKNTRIWRECREYTLKNLSLFKNIDIEYIEGISSKVCASVTLSTMHGCPPEEIEKIAGYLMAEKGLHTYVKCNPTLLGYELTRELLDSMGYGYLAFDRHHFENDLQFEEALPLIGRLLGMAHGQKLQFGIKLTNTFPVKISRKELPGEEMYMSGAALYPLTISVADKMAEAFDGKLPISFSGGADLYNIEQIMRCNIWPVTMSTTLLKPGGYGKMAKIAEKLRKLTDEYPEDLIGFKDINKEALKELAAGAQADSHYRKKAQKERTGKPVGEAGLLCPRFCGNCIDVCPNRANVKITGEGFGPQILHLDDLCNECGNCAGFCGLGDLPYKDRLTLFSGAGTMKDSGNQGFFIEGETGKVINGDLSGANNDTRKINEVIRAVKDHYPYLL